MASQFTDVESRVDTDQLEQDVLAFWERDKIFEESVKQRADGELFTFYDGPPYATGKPHYGHVLQSAIKDTVLRYKTMQGYRVPRRIGWDTHGLPVEVIVEKELGFKSKKDIEEYGIGKFNDKCREVVFRYIDEFTATLKRMGRWAEYGNPYATLDRDFMESEWWAFRQLWDKDLIYKDFRSTPYCIRCATPLSNFETSMAYNDRVDLAVYVRLPVVNMEQTSILIWTTTPWTLPANVAVAYSEAIKYVTVEVNGESFILAEQLVEAIFGDEAKATKTWTHDELAELTYEPLFPDVAKAIKTGTPTYGLVLADHVTAEEGTGLVHMAPAFGAEDAEVGKKNELPVLRTIDTNGKFHEQVPQWGGMNLFEANKPIAEDLEKRGLLLKSEKYTHSYPHCWRCDEPLIYYALDTWFVRVTEFKDRMIAANEKINWIPEHIKEGRFKKGLESAPDWAVSRNRYWSVPVPIWECDVCDERTCVGDVGELQSLSGEKDIPDLHRPHVDKFTWKCAKCDGTMKRIEEVLDVWFDSGSMQFAQWHYPFDEDKKKLVEEGSPADFIVESVEMTRAWFYVLHVLSVAIKDKPAFEPDSPAFKNAIGSGIIFGDDGNKLSKKLKNYPDIDPTLAKYGADTVRMFFVSSTFGEPYVFSEKSLQEMHRNLYQTLWNVYSFFIRYALANDWQRPDGDVPLDSDNTLDQWILSRLRELENNVVLMSERYRFDTAARFFPDFVDDLSNWYVRRSRQRFQVAHSDDAKDTEAALATLYTVLVRVSTLLAPYMPFLTETMYQNLTGNKSVHLQSLPGADSVSSALTESDTKSIDVMWQVRQVVSAGMAVRARAGIKVRQPLADIVIPAIEGLTDELMEMTADELNVKKITVGELPEGSDSIAVSKEEEKVRVALTTALTPELKAEGIARDVIRHGQQLRRQAGYELDDRIVLMVATDNQELTDALASNDAQIKKALQADEVLAALESPDAEDKIKVDGEPSQIGVKKA